MTEIKTEIFHGMTPDEVLYKYTEWCKSRAGDIEIDREHRIEPKVVQAQSGPGRTIPNSYSMLVEWKEKPEAR